MFNRYSFVWVAGFIVMVTAIAMLRTQRFPVWVRVGTPLGLAAVAAVLWLVLRPVGTPEVNTLVDAERLIGTGKPTVIEFFSEY
jgi:hypothetical protein